VRVHVVQGEREIAEDNETLGRFELVGLPPAPRGVPQIEVSFEIDANGVVDVSACDLATGLAQSIRVAASSGLSEREVEDLVEQAAAHAASDRARRDLVALGNQAEGLAYSAERTLRDFSDNVGAEDRKSLETALARVREVLPAGDAVALREAVQALSARTYDLTERLFADFDGGDGSSEG
ncbi:MAG: Hsp70 family protein, partial [Myxococcota bacterium]